MKDLFRFDASSERSSIKVCFQYEESIGFQKGLLVENILAKNQDLCLEGFGILENVI